MKSLVLSLAGLLWLVLGALPTPEVRSQGIAPAISQAETSTRFNPFQEIERQAKGLDLSKSKDLWKLVHEAYRLQLYGTSRRLARELFRIDPEFAGARKYLGYQSVQVHGETRWLTAWERTQWERGLIRHARFGWINPADRDAADAGMIRSKDRRLIPVAEFDALHSTWENRHRSESEFFQISSSLPLEVQWFVADDLERLVTCYIVFFEVPFPPRARSQVHLYRTADDATLAGANVALLKQYGAYYQKETLHVMFRKLGGVTAVRHEAGHALNRAFTSDLPQWLDEGIGVYCQFAVELADGSLQFGALPPRHAFGKKFLDKVKSGHRETLHEILSESHVTMDSEHYSKFRALIDFFMNAEEKKYRMQFLALVFRKQGNLKSLADQPGIEQEWQSFLARLEPVTEWQYLRESERTTQLRSALDMLPTTGGSKAKGSE